MNSYDTTQQPEPGRVIRCAPEVQEFNVDGGLRMRVVLIGKRGTPNGFEPITVVEELAGVSATGEQAWVSLSHDSTYDPADMVAGLFMAQRARSIAHAEAALAADYMDRADCVGHASLINRLRELGE